MFSDIIEGRPKAAEVSHKKRVVNNLKHCESPRPKASECSAQGLRPQSQLRVDQRRAKPEPDQRPQSRPEARPRPEAAFGQGSGTEHYLNKVQGLWGEA